MVFVRGFADQKGINNEGGGWWEGRGEGGCLVLFTRIPCLSACLRNTTTSGDGGRVILQCYKRVVRNARHEATNTKRGETVHAQCKRRYLPYTCVRVCVCVFVCGACQPRPCRHDSRLQTQHLEEATREVIHELVASSSPRSTTEGATDVDLFQTSCTARHTDTHFATYACSAGAIHGTTKC